MKKKQGFTLIELIVVVAIIGIIAGVVVPRYTASFDTVRFRRTMSNLVFFLREERVKSISRAETTRVILDLHMGIFLDEGGKTFTVPSGIEIFTDKIEMQDEHILTFTFYPNGTASEVKLGFVDNKMVAVLHIDPLGGLVYYNMNEEMDQVVRYARAGEVLGDEEVEKYIDKSNNFDTLKKRAVINKGVSEDEEDEEDDEEYDEEDEEDE